MRWSPSNRRLRHPSRQHLRTTPKARCAWQMPRRSLRPGRASNSPVQELKHRKLLQRLQRRKTPSQPLQQHRLTPRKKTARPRSRPTPKARKRAQRRYKVRQDASCDPTEPLRRHPQSEFRSEARTVRAAGRCRRGRPRPGRALRRRPQSEFRTSRTVQWTVRASQDCRATGCH